MKLIKNKKQENVKIYEPKKGENPENPAADHDHEPGADGMKQSETLEKHLKSRSQSSEEIVPEEKRSGLC